MNTLNRRDFLKFAGLVLASGVLPAYPTIKDGVRLFADPQIRFGSNLIKGTAYGAILASSDEGMTWKQVANLGENHAVLQLAQKGKQIYANMNVSGHDFWLHSTDAQRWLTA